MKKLLLMPFLAMLAMVTATAAEAQADNADATSYTGTITITVDGMADELENQTIHITPTSETTGILALYNFSFDGEEILGDIVIDNLTIEHVDGNIHYSGSNPGFTLADDTIEASAVCNGTEYPDGSLVMDIDVVAFGAIEVKVAFNGMRDGAGESGVTSLTVDQNLPVEYFNLNGVKLQAKPAQGVYIQRQGNQAGVRYSK